MIAIVAETKDGSVRKISLEMLAEARRLAQAQGGQTVGAIVLGGLAEGEADRLARHGADTVYVAEGASLAVYAPEAWAEGVRLAVEKAKPDVLLVGATAHGKDLAPRVSARLRVGLASDCVGFEWKDGALIARRPIFAGKAFARVAWSAARPQVASVRPNTFTPVEPDASRKAAVERIAVGDVKTRARVVGFEKSEGEMVDLTEANIIVSGGRAMQGPENFELLRKLCKVLGRHARRVPRGRRRGLDRPQPPGGPDRKGREPIRLLRDRHLGRHPAHGRHVLVQDDRRDQQGQGRSDLQDRVLWNRRGSLSGGTGADGGIREGATGVAPSRWKLC